MTRTIGLIGGMSWESSAEYYRLLNEGVRQRLGGHHSARVVLHSLDFAEVAAMQRAGDWAAAGAALAEAGRGLERAGVDLVLLCTNTMHRVADTVEAAVGVPFLHLVDCTAERLAGAGLRRAGLLGTRHTMELPFYRDRMRARGVEVVVPEAADRAVVDAVIYDELTRGRIEESSRAEYRRIIARLAERGAQGVILGCTEITLLIGERDSPVPVFDSTRLHVEAALDLALAPAAAPAD
ncbi:aspartate racemase [Streptomonospora nanhaiensis]|uniref:Aspartate racemase n=1 Tax=Streptomonospora nanhaiensis TaxID=1323731 RepID=A0A853BXC3_9ACTN|nr:aspartate/glutamate racemase family protein [Streptomonospora nanhaiensis]NYI99141.1 aspartate racemase [Streptomonospora nanhaiensis]